MELAALARKQKRSLDWNKAIDDFIQDQGIKSSMQELLREYRSLIASCWERKAVSSEDQARLEDLERRLNTQSEEGRLRVIGGAYRRTARTAP